MFSKATSLVRRSRILTNNPSFRFSNQSTNDNGQRTNNKKMSERLKEIYETVLKIQGSHMEAFHEFVGAAADEVVLDTDTKLKAAATKAASDLNTTGTALQAAIKKTDKELNETKTTLLEEIDKTKESFKILLIASGAAVSGIVIFGYFFLFKKYNKMEKDVKATKNSLETGKKALTKAQNDLENAKKEFDGTALSLENYYETAWHSGYLKSLETDMDANKHLLKEYNDKITEYWPRPWPSYRTIYREKIQVIETLQERIQEKIQEVKKMTPP